MKKYITFEGRKHQVFDDTKFMARSFFKNGKPTKGLCSLKSQNYYDASCEVGQFARDGTWYEFFKLVDGIPILVDGNKEMLKEENILAQKKMEELEEKRRRYEFRDVYDMEDLGY